MKKGIPVLVFLLGLMPALLFAHAPNQSYVYLRVFDQAIEGSVHVTFTDLNKVLGTSLEKGDTLQDVQPHLEQVRQYFLDNLGFKSALGPHSITFTEVDFLRTSTLGDFLILDFELGGIPADIPEILDVRYSGIYSIDPVHKGMLLIQYNWKAGIHNNESMPSLIFGPGDSEQSLSLSDRSIWNGFKAMVISGMWYIYIGLDHILFLVALLLPAVVFRRKEEEEAPVLGITATSTLPAVTSFGGWLPVEKFKPAFFYVLRIVTLFTISHTITLSLAALQIFTLPGRIVESIIALSIALAAFHNIRPFIKNEALILAFGFGLFHGFGFASVLGDVGLQGDYMVYSLLGFNLGVELGQLTIIVLVFPILFLLRKTKIYPPLLVIGSVLLILISGYWFIERFFEVDLPLGAYLIQLKNAIGL